MSSKSSSQTDDREEKFIHIKELPWLAYHREIVDFFQGLSVKKGGILIRQYDAFVAFDKPSDVNLAMNQENREILGSKVHLSIISKAELRSVLFRIARRKLDFSEVDGVFKKPKANSEFSRRKKIRPTPVVKSKKRKIDPLTFCPKEVDFPPEHVKDVAKFSWLSENGVLPFKKKKIHPVRLSDTIEIENFSTFHPELCYELKNIIVNVS